MKDIIKPTIKLTIATVATRILGMLFFILLARALSISDYGLFRYLLSLSMIYGVFFAGIPVAITRYVGKYKNKRKIYEDYLYNGLFTMLILYLFICLYIIIFSEYKIYLILMLFAVLVDAFYLGFARGVINYLKIGGHKLIENLVQLILLIISFLIYKNVNFSFAIIFYSISGIISLIIFELHKRELYFGNISFKKIKEIFFYSIPVTLGAVSWSILFGINAIFIKQFYGVSELAYYSVAETLVQIMAFLPSSLANIMLPKAASLKNKKSFKNKVTRSVLLTFFLSIGLLIFLFITKEFFIKLLFTDIYMKSSSIILPLAIGYTFVAFYNVYSSVYQGMGKPSIPSKIILTASILNVILSYFLTKSFGIVGSAYSNMISGLVAFSLIIILFYREFRK